MPDLHSVAADRNQMLAHFADAAVAATPRTTSARRDSDASDSATPRLRKRDSLRAAFGLLGSSASVPNLKPPAPARSLGSSASATALDPKTPPKTPPKKPSPSPKDLPRPRSPTFDPSVNFKLAKLFFEERTLSPRTTAESA
jgi:hypothetical protein